MLQVRTRNALPIRREVEVQRIGPGAVRIEASYGRLKGHVVVEVADGATVQATGVVSQAR